MKSDAADPTVVYDLEQVRVAFDRDAGRIDLTVRFGQSLPETSSSSFSSDTASISLDDCSFATRKGDTSVTLRWEDPVGSDPPGYYVTHKVNFRESSTRVPASMSPDRRELYLTINDPLLLQGADLKCVSANGSGRRFHDPTQPGGGPTYDSLDGDSFFDGYGPPELLAPANESATRGFPPPLEWRTGNAPDRLTIAVPTEYSSRSFTLDAGQAGEFTGRPAYGEETLRYRVEFAEGITRVLLLDNIVYRRKYTWSVTRGDATYSTPKTPDRAFTIGAPEVQTLTATVRHRRGTKRASPGSSSFTIASAPLARFELRITRGGKTVKTSRGKLDAGGDAPTLRYTWSCRRTGSHRWIATVTDEYGGKRTKKGSFAVSSNPCRTPRKKSGKDRGSSAKCHPSYPTVCIPPPPPDLDCPDIDHQDFRVTGSDPHRLDADNDGVGCES